MPICEVNQPYLDRSNACACKGFDKFNDTNYCKEAC